MSGAWAKITQGTSSIDVGVYQWTYIICSDDGKNIGGIVIKNKKNMIVISTNSGQFWTEISDLPSQKTLYFMVANADFTSFTITGEEGLWYYPNLIKRWVKVTDGPTLPYSIVADKGYT